MRDYNFRRKAKTKEQINRKILWNDRGYWPSMPHKGKDENGQEYFTEGMTGTYKSLLKRQANKAVRKSKLDDISSGGSYKRVYSLANMWY